MLGFGGLEMLRKLDLGIDVYHMNEGHSALLALSLMERRLAQSFAGRVKQLDIDGVRRMCIFTTHTPVPAGHDQFPRKLAEQVLGAEAVSLLDEAEAWHGDMLNMTYLALRFSGYVNGVAMRHGEVSRGMFPNYTINAITNGVHAVTWTAPASRRSSISTFPGGATITIICATPSAFRWNRSGRRMPRAKQELFEEILQRQGVQLDPQVLTIGFARRASTYKRADLLFHDAERLQAISRNIGPIQLVYGGKAHPRDEGGKNLIRSIFGGASRVADAIRTVYVENYDLHWGAPDHQRRGPVAEYADAAAGGFRHQRNESRAQRRAQLQRAGRLVGRGSHRGRDRLEHRGPRIHWRPRPRSVEPVRKAGTRNCSHVLRAAAALYGDHALRDCAQRIFFQYPANAAAVRGECLYPAE